MSTDVASDHRIRRLSIEILGTDRLTSEALAKRLTEMGLELGEDGVERVEAILDDSSSFMAVGEDWVAVAAQLDGTRWVTRIDADDAADDLLKLDPDLCLLAWWSLDSTLLLGDTNVHLEPGELWDDDVLVGPEGWLRDYAGGDVVVRIEGERIHLSVPDHSGSTRSAPAELVAAAAAAFDRRATNEVLHDGLSGHEVDLTQTSLEELVWEALVSAPDAFRSGEIPPVDVVLAGAGLQRSEHTVLRAGADVVALRRWHLRNRIGSMHGLDGADVDLAELAVGVSRAAVTGAANPFGPAETETAVATAVAAALHDPAVCKTLLGFHHEWDTPRRALAEFARSLADAVPADQRAGALWLQGRALDLAGDAGDAHAAFEAAVATGTEHELALLDLARLRADAGDAPGAVALLVRMGIVEALEEGDEPDEEIADLFDEVAGYAEHRPRPRARRNDPCPCGSGRKYKACHLGQERHALIDRAPWLYAKHQRFASSHERPLVAELAAVVSRGAQRGAGFLLELLDSGLVADVALCEGGVAERFLAKRDAFLPDDEALLAARWQLVERSLFEIEDVGESELALRDVRSGERIVVTNTNPSSQTRRGDLMLGRPLPVDDTWRAFSGFVTVNGMLRDAILAALDANDPFEIAELTGRCMAPPTLTNTDGQALRFHELVWHVADEASARDALDRHDALDEDDGVYRLVRDSKNQPRTVILTLTPEGDELRGEVNSDERLAEMIELVASMVEGADLVDHDVRELGEVMDAGPSPDDAPPRNLLDDPEMADVRAEIVAEFERRWLDEPVPALGDRTPRQAAEDPIGRHELVRLLESFEHEPGLMDPHRLRRALGL